MSQDKAKLEELRSATVGSFLRARRDKAGLTQSQVATALGYETPQFVSNWERGVSLPPLGTLPQLARLLKVADREFIAVMTRYQDEVAKLETKRLSETFRKSRAGT